MAGQRQPIELVIANGKKNLTKAEIQERRDSEVKPITDNIIAPSYLTKKQKKRLLRASFFYPITSYLSLINLSNIIS